MPVECPGAALRTRNTPESYLLNHSGQPFDGIFKQTVTFLCKRRDSQGNRSQGNVDHLIDLPGTRDGNLIVLTRVFWIKDRTFF